MSKPTNTILLPVDFSDQSLIAISQSYNLAKFTNSKLLLLHVDDGTVSDVKEKLEKRAEKVEKESGLEVKSQLVKGSVFEQITKVADKVKPVFIIMGITSKISLDKVIGHNAFRMVRESEYPVITIRGKHHRNGCANILLPLDLTKETREKVGKAIELAKYFGAAVRILSVFKKEERALENKLLAYSHQVKNFIKENGVACTNKTVEGKDISKIVVDYAKEVDADLIMLMSKQELSLKEFFIGTTAQRIINTSEVPVLSIRPMKRKDTSVWSK